MCEQLQDNSQSFPAISVALDESKDQTVKVQLAIFISGINDELKVTEDSGGFGGNAWLYHS